MNSSTTSSSVWNLRIPSWRVVFLADGGRLEIFGCKGQVPLRSLGSAESDRKGEVFRQANFHWFVVFVVILLKCKLLTWVEGRCGSQAARLHLPNVTFTSQFDARLRQTSDHAQVAYILHTVAHQTRHHTTQILPTWPSPAPVSVKRAKSSAPTTVCFFFHDPPIRSPGLTTTSRLPPCRLRRPPPFSPRHNRLPRRDPDRLHNRNMPLRRSQRVLLAAPENQSRRL